MKKMFMKTVEYLFKYLRLFFSFLPLIALGLFLLYVVHRVEDQRLKMSTERQQLADIQQEIKDMVETRNENIKKRNKDFGDLNAKIAENQDELKAQKEFLQALFNSKKKGSEE